MLMFREDPVGAHEYIVRQWVGDQTSRTARVVNDSQKTV
jgi:hypothetical protein